MSTHVLWLKDVDVTNTPVVGGKAAQLAELARVEGTMVPPAFCVTTYVFDQVKADVPEIDDRLDRLGQVDGEDEDTLRALSANLRQDIEAVVIPDGVAATIADRLHELGSGFGYAVRSSATAEDLPAASFAGQHDSYMNIVGVGSVLEHVKRCWASLFNDRAVAYRNRNGFGHSKLSMAVVVQRMVDADAAGVAFTADPVTSNRAIVSIEATFGLGETLVAGLVNADVYRVSDGQIVDRTVAVKDTTLASSATGGTRTVQVEAERRSRPALDDARVLELARLARRIEGHFGTPQDIEWCLADDRFHIVQSRPITNLFPIPQVDDDANHVYVSVGHGQMMTDAMKPLGISMWQLTSPAPMRQAGGRLFVDVTARLSSPASRGALVAVMGRGDPLIANALETVLAREGFVPTIPDDAPVATPTDPPAPLEADPVIVRALIQENQDSVAELKDRVRSKSGVELFEFILADLQELKRLLFDPLSTQAVMAGMEATWWLNDQLELWLGEKGAAATLTLAAPNNVTSEMGLALLDVADVIRPHRDVIDYLKGAEEESFLDRLPALDGGQEAQRAIGAYLDRYGMRCIGEIDITRPRWAERPSALLPAILGNVENFEPGEAVRRVEAGRKQALEKEGEVLDRLRILPDGEEKARETKRMIGLVRTFIGYREYPKYGMICRYFVYRQALLEEAGRLVRAQVIGDIEDIYYLTFQELHDLARTHQPDHQLIRRRRADFARYQSLSPPRVLTSDGEALGGEYKRQAVPPGALVGVAVSGGSVEGRARIVRDIGDADLEPGDILVTTFTDPSWSLLFVTIKGLVTEVGGLMTHGAVIAREYGLTAVVGVEAATELIRDGQTIRVNGTEGYVEVLD